MTTYKHEEALQASREYFGGDDLAATVFVTKYALRDKDGALLEKTPADMHRRLAREFARIEAKYPNPMSEDEIFALFDKFKYVVPQGSPMSAIGNKDQVQSLSNCFIAGTMVHTVNRGPVPIEDVVIGDEVVTHLGRPQKVLQLHKNKLNGRKLYKVKPFRSSAFVVTDNHRILSLTKEQIEWGINQPTWNTVDKLRKGDFVAIPTWNGKEQVENFDISVVPVPNDVGYTTHVTKEDVELTITFAGGKGAHPTKRMQPLKRYWQVDEDFAFFVGLWLGDGCVFSTRKGDKKLAGITLTFNAKERKIAEWAMSYVSRAFGINSTLQDAELRDGSLQVRCNSPLLAYAFRHFFGRGFNKKKLHASFHAWPTHFVEKLIAGMLTADGTVTGDGDVRLVLANKDLIQGVYAIGRRCGMLLGISKSDRRHMSTEDVWRIDFPKCSKLLRHVRKEYADNRIEKALSKNENGQHILTVGGYNLVAIRDKQPCNDVHDHVYTLGINEDHSYVVEGILVENCFVINSPLDSYGSIARADENVAQIQKRRGGVGLDISNIRPKTVRVKNAAGTSDGIGIFMERYSNTTREVAQSGRRGALMLTIDGRHPDVETFINIKQDKTKVTGANVSVRVTDDFMLAVENDATYTLRWPVTASVEEAKFTKTIVARELWKQMMHAAWASAEPGILYWDTVLSQSMADEFADKGFETICTNPCAELVLSRADSCRLLLLNLISYVNDPYTTNATFDYKLFAEHACKAQRLMDDLVDLEIEAIDRILLKVESDPEPESEKIRELALWREIREACVNGRRTGTGITALGDAIAALGLTYGRPDSIDATEAIYRELALATHAESCVMALERGPFPAWEPGRYKANEFADRLVKASDQDTNELFFNHGRRNIALTTTAPAGSVSTLTQTTSGIEPAYLLHYKRRKKLAQTEIDNGAVVDYVDALGDKWQEYDVYHHGLRKWMDVTGEIDIEKSPYHKATSNDIDWIASVDLLAAAQKWTEHSISKTINLPNSATEELVSEVYMRAWKMGIKGVTVYRDGCRDGVLVAADKKEEKKSSDIVVDRHAPKRPKVLECDIQRATVKGEKYLVLVGLLEGRPYEVFCGLSDKLEVPKKFEKGKLLKNGKNKDGLSTYNLAIDLGDGDELVVKDLATMFDNATYSSFTRMVSLSLRHGVPVQFVCEQMSKSLNEDMQSFAKVLSRVLKKYIPDGTKSSAEKSCSSCGSANVYYSEGCLTCQSCGSSRCS